jgi:hypothetical protein
MATPEQLADWRWRLDNLYTLTDEDGRKIPFRLRPAQRDCLSRAHKRNLILKARRIGFTSLWAIFALDQCIFHANTSALFISQDVPKAEETFDLKIRSVYDDLPDDLKAAVEAKNDSTRRIAFSNGSRVRVDLSGRGGTNQFLHVSELGKIAAAFPKKAREIKSGAFPAAERGVIVVESTAEGQDGLFYKLCQQAQERSLLPEPLSSKEFKFFFYPWWVDHQCRIDPTSVILPGDLVRYFDALEDSLNDLIGERRAPEWLRNAATLLRKGGWIELDAAQRAWYAHTAALQDDDMKREYPATPDEAFEASIEGAFYKKELARAVQQGRYADFPYDPRLGAVWTFHDIGRGVHACWWAQRDKGYWRFFLYREWHHGGVADTARILQEERSTRGLTYARHMLPHDGTTKDWSADLSRADELASRLGVTRDMIDVVPRTKDVFADHQTVKNFIDLSRFDRQGAPEGWTCLSSYKRAYSDTLGAYLEKEHEGPEIHGADAYRTAAMADFHGMIIDEGYLASAERQWSRSTDEGRNRTTGY